MRTPDSVAACPKKSKAHQTQTPKCCLCFATGAFVRRRTLIAVVTRQGTVAASGGCSVAERTAGAAGSDLRGRARSAGALERLHLLNSALVASHQRMPQRNQLHRRRWPTHPTPTAAGWKIAFELLIAASIGCCCFLLRRGRAATAAAVGGAGSTEAKKPDSMTD